MFSLKPDELEPARIPFRRFDRQHEEGVMTLVSLVEVSDGPGH